jgi:phosphoribosyl-ATP pyrophosphohydrolase/phosphoribosyl-AMP cyclohydrolase
MVDLGTIKFDKQGLVPAVIQDAGDGQVLMLGYMNLDSLKLTLKSGRVNFFSRSRNRLWEKGETSGNYLELNEILYDCDQDALLLKVIPAGPTCHTGEKSCFYRYLERPPDKKPTPPAKADILEAIYKIILQRKKERPTGSYVASLMEGGQEKIARKIGEEALEVVLASQGKEEKALVNELADLWFHSLVLLGYKEIPPRGVWKVLQDRFGQSGGKDKGAG